MKILHIIPNLAGGGAERFVVDLANEMAKTEEVYVCTLFDLVKGKNDFFLEELSSSIKIVSLGKKLGLDFSIYGKIRRIVDQIKPDIVNTHLASINYVLLKSISDVVLRTKIKFFHTLHSDAKFEIKHRLEFYTRKLLYKFKIFTPITISEESRKSFRDYYEMTVDMLIHNGRKLEGGSPNLTSVKEEIDSLKKTANTKVLLNVGRFVAIKNQFMLAKIVTELIREGEDIILLIIGDHSLPEGLEIRDQILKLSCNRIHLLGTKTNVRDYMILSDAFCLSSIYEGLPISLIEAMSVGCVPICTPVGGMKNIVNPKVGYLAAELTAESYRKSIDDFLISLNNDEIKHNLIELYNQKFNIISTAGAYINTYKS
jgi:glycosyltransferase involved in cell wall biosynthesis